MHAKSQLGEAVKQHRAPHRGAEMNDMSQPTSQPPASTPTSAAESLGHELFSTFIDVGVALCQSLRLRDLLVTMMRRVQDTLDAEACSVMLLDESGQTLRWEVALGEQAHPLQTLTVPLGQGVSGRVAASGTSERIEIAETDAAWTAKYDAVTGFRTRAILCVPIRTRNEILGVIQVLNRRTGSFTETDQELLEAIASIGGVAIENARLYETLERRVEERTAELTAAMAELREAQGQLVQSEKMAALGNLVAGVAHEINTPLGAIASNTDLLGRAIAKLQHGLEAPGSRDAAQRYLERASRVIEVSREACQRISAVVKSLRNFSRLDESAHKPADLHEGLESTLTLIRHLIKDRVTVHREYGSIPLVPCHPNQLNQVFLNLLVNAAQSIEGNGEITIRTGLVAAGDMVSVEVHDTGTGIAPEHLGKIFDPGFTTKGVGVGTGLGLSISYRIVSAHQGRIEVDSAPGRGTSFRVLLPVQ